MNIDTFLQKLGVADHPGLRIDRQLMGYQDYTFGCRITSCRPSPCHLAHELAHAAQFGPKHFERRARQYGFDFKMRTVEVFGHVYSEPNTAHATVRELQTFAFQAHLLELGGVRVNHGRYFRRAAVILTNHMPDWHAVPGKTEAERFKWCVNKAKTLYELTPAHVVVTRLNGWLDETARFLATQPAAG